jgi:hypothetical protein
MACEIQCGVKWVEIIFGGVFLIALSCICAFTNVWLVVCMYVCISVQITKVYIVSGLSKHYK